MAVEHNTELDEEAKKYLPEGVNLSVDRLFDAEHITTDLNKWKRNTNRMDLAGFDTTDAREPKPEQIVEQLTGRNSAEQVVMSEPDRLVGKGKAGDLLKRFKNEIVDFDSFKQAVKKAWDSDDSLRNMFAGDINKNLKDSGDGVFKPMFDTPLVQKWIMENTHADVMRYLMKRFNIEPLRAERVWGRLSADRQRKLVNRVIRLNSRRRVAEPMLRQRTPKIRQVSRRGMAYERAKPLKWTENQVQFIHNRRMLPIERLLEEYNGFYRDSPRTQSSIQNKLYRLRRG